MMKLESDEEVEETHDEDKESDEEVEETDK